MELPLTLTERLQSCADLWAAATDSTPARLARLVVNDTSFFSGLPTRVKGPSVDTLEKFARYFAEPANWPEAEVPQAAFEFAHVLGISRDAAAAPTGETDELSGRAPVLDRNAA